MSKYLSREQILGAQDLTQEEVEVPEWGGVVLVRGLTGAQRDRFEASMVEQKGKERRINMENLRAKLVAMSIIDENGKRLFTQQDIDALAKKSGAALDRVYAVAQRLSGLSKEDVEDLVGNSEPGQSDDSTFD